MATPQTAAQIDLMMKAFRPEWVQAHMLTYNRRLLDLMMLRLFPPRPITDDMRQMLDDLGIDWTERQPLRRCDTIKFQFRNH